MGQITKALLEMINKHCIVHGVMPILTLHEMNQLAILAYAGLTSIHTLQPSKTIETQYGPHDPTRVGGWVCIRWDKDYPTNDDTYTSMVILESDFLRIADIHKHQLVFNVTDNRFVKNRTMLSRSDVVRLIENQLMYIVDRKISKGFDRMYANLRANNGACL